MDSNNIKLFELHNILEQKHIIQNKIQKKRALLKNICCFFVCIFFPCIFLKFCLISSFTSVWWNYVSSDFLCVHCSSSSFLSWSCYFAFFLLLFSSFSVWFIFFMAFWISLYLVSSSSLAFLSVSPVCFPYVYLYRVFSFKHFLIDSPFSFLLLLILFFSIFFFSLWLFFFFITSQIQSNTFSAFVFSCYSTFVFNLVLAFLALHFLLFCLFSVSSIIFLFLQGSWLLAFLFFLLVFLSFFSLNWSLWSL